MVARATVALTGIGVAMGVDSGFLDHAANYM